MENREELLYTYACEKFEQQKYDEALEALILLYGKAMRGIGLKTVSISAMLMEMNHSLKAFLNCTQRV